MSEKTTATKKARFSRKGFSHKEKLFCDFYLGDARFVGVRAVRLAGYDCATDASARSVASQLLHKEKIRRYLDQELAALTIGKFEVCAELSRQATADFSTVLDERGMFDFDKSVENGSIANLKKYKITTIEKKVDSKTEKSGGNFNDEPETETLETSLIHKTVELELWNKQTALELLGKNYKLWTDKLEATGADGEPLGDGSKVILFLPDNGRGDAPDLERGALPVDLDEIANGNVRGDE